MNLEDDLDALTERAARALIQDIRERMEEAVAQVRSEVVHNAARDLHARLAVKLAAHYNMGADKLEVTLCIDGVKQETKT